MDDFAKAIRYPENPEKKLAKYSNDWLHPNKEGYAFLGKSVDLDLFTEIENNRTVFPDAGSSQTVIDYGKLIIRKNCKNTEMTLNTSNLLSGVYYGKIENLNQILQKN